MDRRHQLAAVARGGGGGEGDIATGTADTGQQHQNRRQFHQRSCVEFCFHAFTGWTLLIGLMVYHAVVFAVFLSLAIGVATFLSQLRQLLHGDLLSSTTTSCITILLVAIWGEHQLVLQANSSLGRWIRAQKRNHPCTLKLIPASIYTILYFVALTQLCHEYLIVHGLKPLTWDAKDFQLPHWNESSGYEHEQDGGGGGADIDDDDEQNSSSGADKLINDSTNSNNHATLMNNATFGFLLSLSYMSYIVARTTDWITYCCHQWNFLLSLPYFSWKLLWAFVKYLIIQIGLLVMYLFPIMFVCAIGHELEAPPAIIFFIVMWACVILGINAVSFEAKKPFPFLPQVGPSYEFENHLCARSILLNYFLHPLILLPFFFSNSPSKFDIGPKRSYFQPLLYYLTPQHKFYIYLLCVGSAIIQTTKIVSNAFFSKDLLLYDPPPPVPPRRRRFGAERNAVIEENDAFFFGSGSQEHCEQEVQSASDELQEIHVEQDSANGSAPRISSPHRDGASGGANDKICHASSEIRAFEELLGLGLGSSSSTLAEEQNRSTISETGIGESSRVGEGEFTEFIEPESSRILGESTKDINSDVVIHKSTGEMSDKPDCISIAEHANHHRQQAQPTESSSVEICKCDASSNGITTSATVTQDVNNNNNSAIVEVIIAPEKFPPSAGSDTCTSPPDKFLP